MKIRSVLSLFSVLLAGAVFAQGLQLRTVHGKGRNADYRQATFEALSAAVSQVQGLSLSDARDTFITSASSASHVVGAVASETSSVQSQLKQNVSIATRGLVHGYEVTSETYDPELKEWVVEVDAQVPERYVLGRDPNALRRMIVMPFAFEKNGGDARYCEKMADELNRYLTQTRRFTMLDRRFQAEVEAELGRLRLANASSEDITRSAQQLVSDYMVTGTVKTYPAPQPVQNPYTGGYTVSDGCAAEVSYRVILVPTTQLKWQNTVRVMYSECGSPDGAWAVLAAKISREIIENIYPIRITAKTAMELVLNQGGVAVPEGGVYEVFIQGEPIEDVTTHEMLPGPETMIARIRVVRSDPKMSYAVVMDGTDFANIPVGALVRQPRTTAAGGAVAAPRTGDVQVHPNGGVVPPWQVK